MARVRLGDVAREYKETIKDSSSLPIVGLEHLTPGEISLEHWDEGVENTFSKGFKKGHMLFGRRRAYLRKAALAPFDGVCSGDITVIEAIPEKMDPELLPFIIQNDLLFDYAVGNSAGSLSPRVKWESLQNYEFELPERTKQAEMVELLKAAHETRRTYKALIQATDDLVKSQFIEMFEREGFPSKAIKELFMLQMGKTPERKELKYWNSNDYRWISVADLGQYGKYTDDTKEYISETAKKESGIRIVPKNTVIMSFKLTIGRTAITSEDIYTNEAIMAFIPKTTDFDLDYLRYALGYKDWTKGMQIAVKGATLNKDIIGRAKITIPPMQLQKRFAAFVEQSDKSKFVVSNRNLSGGFTGR